ncbi:magnesium/cobalt transporter CorA [bacterium]|nr:magnesium/cobalt transporter CorA [bacterium]
MTKLMRSLSKQVKNAPGELKHIDQKNLEKVKISLISYDHHDLVEKQIEDIKEIDSLDKKVTWINIDGIHNVDILEKIGQKFNIHPLVLEDIVTLEQRPKAEVYEDFIFVVLKMIYFNHNDDNLKIEQVSLIVKGNYVLSFQELPGDVFDFIRERLRKAKGNVRTMGVDYLFYLLIDAVVDGYFVVLEKLGDEIEKIEENVLLKPTVETLHSIHSLKREMIFLRRAIWPLRESINNINREESKIISKKVIVYFKDVYDHTIQVIDTIEAFRDMVAGMLDIYLSSMSNKMNEVMKLLTMIATMFIPITFLAGVYGMNFKYMPELHAKWAYPLFWVIVFFVIGGMFLFFKKKKWL